MALTTADKHALLLNALKAAGHPQAHELAKTILEHPVPPDAEDAADGGADDATEPLSMDDQIRARSGRVG